MASALVRACPGVPTHAWPIPVLTGEFSIRFLALLTTILACLKQECGSGGLKLKGGPQQSFTIINGSQGVLQNHGNKG